ncbi:MAG TPA: hypothetical protein VN181_06905 [Thermoanaerobaculia bacterium]|nr:hypothetical protein [Thermoanaerobaculia bacterium]
MKRAAVVALLLFALRASAQHDITKVDPAPPGTAVATPLPEAQRRKLKRYDLPELAGAQQAIGSQLIDGRLPRPLFDFIVQDGNVDQRVSLFEGGLVVIKLTGTGTTIYKKVLLPPDALQSYLRGTSAAALRAVDARALTLPELNRRARLRVYDSAGGFVERAYHPGSVLPKQLSDQVMPLQDLLRVISEDRTVTSSVSGYEPQVGDELVADDEKKYRVVRIVEQSGVVELKCLDAPTSIYVAKKELANYFVGKPR